MSTRKGPKSLSSIIGSLPRARKQQVQKRAERLTAQERERKAVKRIERRAVNALRKDMMSTLESLASRPHTIQMGARYFAVGRIKIAANTSQARRRAIKKSIEKHGFEVSFRDSVFMLAPLEVKVGVTWELVRKRVAPLFKP